MEMEELGDLEFDELLDKFIEEKRLYRMEGQRGVENLCRIVRACGYKDPQQYGQFAPDAALGDLLSFLEDNPGAIEALITWIQVNGTSEWHEAIQSKLLSTKSGEEEEEEDDDGALMLDALA